MVLIACWHQGVDGAILPEFTKARYSPCGGVNDKLVFLRLQALAACRGKCASGAGGRYARELCGRSVLYSFCHAEILGWASSSG
jgi:hypothetical protein